jgi:hypothetical protein
MKTMQVTTFNGKIVTITYDNREVNGRCWHISDPDITHYFNPGSNDVVFAGCVWSTSLGRIHDAIYEYILDCEV